MITWFKGRDRRYRMWTHPRSGKLYKEMVEFRIVPIFKWFDIWIGIYIDQKERIIYFFPIPMVGFKIGYQFSDNDSR